MSTETSKVIINRYLIAKKIKIIIIFYYHHLPFYFLWRFFTVLLFYMLFISSSKKLYDMHAIIGCIKVFIIVCCVLACLISLLNSPFPPKKLTSKKEKRPPLKKTMKCSNKCSVYFSNIFGIHVLPFPFKSYIFYFVKCLYLFEISYTNGRICNDKLKKDGFDLWIMLLVYISFRYQGDALTLKLQILSGNSWAFLQSC